MQSVVARQERPSHPEMHYAIHSLSVDHVLVGNTLLLSQTSQENLAPRNITFIIRIHTKLPYLRVYKPGFLGQEFGNNNNSSISRTRLNLCESKIFAIAFAALWLSLAAFAIICQ
jgi:hypothetical protein